MDESVRNTIWREHHIYGESWKSIQNTLRWIYHTFVSKADILAVIEGKDPSEETTERHPEWDGETW